MLAVCHTVMVEEDKTIPQSQNMTDNLKYSASSPDELALVMGAKDVGITYYKRTASTISIRLGGEPYSK